MLKYRHTVKIIKIHLDFGFSSKMNGFDVLKANCKICKTSISRGGKESETAKKISEGLFDIHPVFL